MLVYHGFDTFDILIVFHYNYFCEAVHFVLCVKNHNSNP